MSSTPAQSAVEAFDAVDLIKAKRDGRSLHLLSLALPNLKKRLAIPSNLFNECFLLVLGTRQVKLAIEERLLECLKPLARCLGLVNVLRRSDGLDGLTVRAK